MSIDKFVRAVAVWDPGEHPRGPEGKFATKASGVVRGAGAIWGGVQTGVKGERYAVFTDPMTKSTTMLPEGRVSHGAVRRSLRRIRRQWGMVAAVRAEAVY